MMIREMGTCMSLEVAPSHLCAVICVFCDFQCDSERGT